MKKLTDDEIMAAALLCPESEKVPLEVGDRVIALETFTFWYGLHKIRKGECGTYLGGYEPKYRGYEVAIQWDGEGAIYGALGPIGKLVKRGSV